MTAFSRSIININKIHFVLVSLSIFSIHIVIDWKMKNLISDINNALHKRDCVHMLFYGLFFK